MNMNLPELIRIDFAGLRALARADGALPPVLDALADSRLLLYAQRAMADSIVISKARGGEAWWDRTVCPLHVLKQELADLVNKGDMVKVLNLAAMIYVRECADASASGWEGR